MPRAGVLGHRTVCTPSHCSGGGTWDWPGPFTPRGTERGSAIHPPAGGAGLVQCPGPRDSPAGDQGSGVEGGHSPQALPPAPPLLCTKPKPGARDRAGSGERRRKVTGQTPNDNLAYLCYTCATLRARALLPQRLATPQRSGVNQAFARTEITSKSGCIQIVIFTNFFFAILRVFPLSCLLRRGHRKLQRCSVIRRPSEMEYSRMLISHMSIHKK